MTSSHTIAELAAFHANLCVKIRVGVDQPAVAQPPITDNELPDFLKDVLAPLGNESGKQRRGRK